MDRWRGGKGMYTYMFGVQRERTSMMHHVQWARLCELSTMHQVLEAIFGATGYWCSGGFGVFTLPGAGYQPLHTDGGIVPVKTELDAHGRVSNIVPIDEDGDGFSVNCDDDCDDGNRWIYPNARELIGDGIDQDCNGTDAIVDFRTKNNHNCVIPIPIQQLAEYPWWRTSRWYVWIHFAQG